MYIVKGNWKINLYLFGLSSRNMGKNDLWIASTAHVLEATLITTDNDYDHLENVYFELVKIKV